MTEKIGLEAVLELGSFRNAVSQYNSAVSGMSSHTASMASSISSSFGGLGSSILDIGAKTAQIAIGGIATLALTLTGIGVAGTKAFIELEQGFANLEAISGDTKAQLEPLKGLISELALDPNLKVTATQATEALYALTKQGLSVEEIMGGAGRATVELSNATGAQFTPAATIAAGVMKAWNIEASNLSTVADGMTGVLTNSKFTVDDYNLAFAQSGTIFSNLGGSLTDFNTIIGGTASAFSGGSDAGTSFKNLILTMSAPTKEAKAAMQQYGISIFNTDGTMKNWSEVAGQLNKVLYGTVTVTNTVGGATKEQAAAAEKASDSISDLTRDIGQQRDKLQLMNDVYQESLKFYDAGEPKMRAQALAIERLSSNITDQEEQLGEYQQAILAVDGAQARTITSTEKLTEAERAKLAETIAGRDSSRLLLELGKLTSDQYDELSQKINTNGQAMNAASIRMDTTSGALDILRGIIEAINFQIGEKFTPMVKAAAKATSLWASENSGTIIAFFGSIATGIQNTITGMGQLFSTFQTGGAAGLIAALGITPDAISLFEKFRGMVTQIADTIAGPLMAAFSGLSTGGVLDTINQGITFLNEHFAELQGALLGIGAVLATGVFAAIAAGIFSIITPFTLLGATVVLFSTAWAGNWGNIQGIAQQALVILTTVFNTLSAVALSLANTIKVNVWPPLQEAFNNITLALNNMGLTWGDVWNALATATKIVAGTVGVILLGLIGTITGLVSGFASAFATITSYFTDFQNAIAQFVNGVTTLFTGLVTVTSGLLIGDLGMIFEGVEQSISGLFDTIGGLGKFLLTAMQASLGGVFSFVKGWMRSFTAFFDGLAPALGEKFENTWTTIRKVWKPEKWFELGESIILGILEGIKENQDKVLELLKSLLGDAIQAAASAIGYNSPAAAFMPLGASIPQGIAAGINDAAPLAQSAINSLMTGLTATDPRFIHQFIDDLDIGGALRARNVDRNSALGKGISDALKAGVGGFMSQLQGNVGMADVTAWVETIGQQWGQSLSTIAHYVDIGKLYQEIKGKFDEMWSKVRLDNLANAAGIASNFSGFASAFAGMLESQMETFNKAREEALKLGEANTKLNETLGTQEDKLATLQKELAELSTAEEADTIAIEKKTLAIEKATEALGFQERQLVILQDELANLTTGNGQNAMAIEKTTEALGFGERQLAIYNEELAKLTPDTLPWDKKKLAIDKLTETMDMQRQQLVKLQAQNDIDTLSIDKKKLAIDKLVEGIDNQQKQLVILKEELVKLTEATELDTGAIERKQAAIAELSGEIDKNRVAIAKNEEALKKHRKELERQVFAGADAFASGQDQLQGSMAMIEILQDFLDSGLEQTRIIGEELGGVFAGTGVTSDIFLTRVWAQEELNRLLAEQQRREEEITKQKEAQQKLDFLMQQINLIKLISDRGLNPANILNGITLGLNAGAVDLLAATNRIVEAMVNQINTDLQIGSPSGLMIKIFKQVMAGAAIGMERGQSLLTDAMRSIPILNGSIPQPVFSQAGGVSSSSSSTYNYNFPMTVTTAAGPEAVVRQYEIKRSMYAASS